MSDAGATEVEVAPDGRFWWAVMLMGVLTAILGLFLIFRPFDSITALAVLAGLCLLVSGIGAFFSARRRELGIGWAVVSIISGIVLLVWPSITLQVLAVVAGIGFLIRGVIRAVIAIIDHDEYWGALLAVGVIGALLGIVIIAWPDATIAVIGIVIGVNALIAGIGEIALSVDLKRVANSPA